MRTPLALRAVLALSLLGGAFTAPSRRALAEDAPAADAPRAALDRASHDFGVAAQEVELRTSFTVRNAGTGLLRLIDLRSDCGCGAATTDRRELGPGASTTIQVTLRTLTMAGALHKRILLRTNDPEHPVTEFGLLVDVAAGIVLEPARFYFGEVPAGTSPTTNLRAKWKEGVGTPFRLTGVEALGLDLELTTKPYLAGAWKGFEITATFRRPPPVGTVQGSVILRTDDPAHPRIPLAVQAYVSGKVWVDRRAVNLGMVPAGKGRQVAVICRPFGEGVALGQVTARARVGAVEARAVPSGKEWVVLIRLPEAAASGAVEDVVEVASEIPGEPPAEIRVSGFVTAAQGGK